MLKADWIDGDTVDGAAMSAIGEAVNAIPGYHVDAYGADPTGASASDTAVAAARTAIGTSKGILVFGCGTYRLDSSTTTFANPGQGVAGQGKGATVIDYRGTGACFSAHYSTTTVSPGGVSFTGFSIDGTNNSNINVTGLEVGDFYQPRIHDVWIHDFDAAGNIAFHGLNNSSWCERAVVDIVVDNCTNAFVFETGAANFSYELPDPTSSWCYSDFTLSWSLAANQQAIVVKTNMQMAGVRLLVYGNSAPNGAGSNTGVGLTVGTTAEDESYIIGQIQMECEVNGTGVAHKDIDVGAASIIRGYGSLWFTAPMVAGSATPGTVQFFGQVNCPSLGALNSASAKATGAIQTSGILDPDGEILLDTSADIADAVNHIGINNAATGSRPYFFAAGGDNNIGFDFFPKGTGYVAFYDGNGKEVFLTNAGAANACNYLYFQNSATNNPPSLGVWGSDSAIGLDLATRGAGVVTANSNPVSTRVAVPSTASSAGSAGMWATDGSYLYVCTANATWVRGAVTFATW